MNLNMKNKTFSVHDVVLTGVLAACVFVLTKFISIPIPSPLGKTALSVGNAMCILSALLFGPLTGGLAAGIGNALVDLSDPAWAPEFWITFINNFLMAFVAGIIMHKVPVIASKVPEKFRAWLAGFCGLEVRRVSCSEGLPALLLDGWRSLREQARPAPACLSEVFGFSSCLPLWRGRMRQSFP